MVTTTDRPKISIIAPVYGVERYIEQFLSSIAHQDFDNYEVILIDDGSPDKCPEILDEFAHKNKKCRVIHQSNAGVSVARNKGLDLAKGEYVYIVDSDDWLEQGALSRLYSEAEKTNADIIYGDWISEKEGNSKYQRSFPNEFVTENTDTIKKLQYSVNYNNYKVRIDSLDFSCIYHLGGAPWRGMIRLDIVRKNNLYFDPYVKGLGDDVLFSLHLYEYVKKVSYISFPIYHYRELNNSYSHGYKADYIEVIRRVFEKQEKFLEIYDKDNFLYGSYYTRVLIYLDQGMERYFQNSLNRKGGICRYKEFKEILLTEPFFTMSNKVPIRYLGSKRLILGAVLLRLKLYCLYWMMHLILKMKNRK